MRHVLLGVGSVPPQLVNRAIARSQDIQGLLVVVVVLRSPCHVVEVAVPRRQVEGGQSAELMARVHELANHVSLSVSPLGANHGVVAVLRREQPRGESNITENT